MYAVLNLSRVALARDEVFLILVFIYGEMKRQAGLITNKGAWEFHVATVGVPLN